VLSSGLHSPVFLQKNLVFMHAERTERLCRALAERIRTEAGAIDVVISPAVGGIIPGYETARQLGVPGIYVEREGGVFKLRRGFPLAQGARVVMVEDIVTTGLSSREAIAAIRENGGEVVAGACIVDRSGGKADIGVPLISLAQVSFPVFEEDKLPPELAAPPHRGSRQPEDRAMSQRVRLGVNIDHVATVRNARGGVHPDPLRAAELALAAGADGITAHLREDRRHIADGDIERLAELTHRVGKPLNFEMAVTDEMLEIALRHRPHAACLVPERREERTTEGGLEVAGQHNTLKPFVSQLREAGIRVSLFIQAAPEQIAAAEAVGAQVVELHTGAYCEAVREGDRPGPRRCWPPCAGRGRRRRARPRGPRRPRAGLRDGGDGGCDP
jgi:orotate phosphoribosyltransferase